MTIHAMVYDDAADYIQEQIAAGAKRIEEANCLEWGHSWGPGPYGRLRCVLCSLAPHIPIHEETR